MSLKLKFFLLIIKFYITPNFRNWIPKFTIALNFELKSELNLMSLSLHRAFRTVT